MSKLEDKLWKVFSEYIRRRDAKAYSDGDIAKCITCHREEEWKYMDCGHFISRSYKATKFHEQNNHAQCIYCNRQFDGMPKAYESQIRRRYGEATPENLKRESRQFYKKAPFEIQEMIDHYKKEIKSLKESA